MKPWLILTSGLNGGTRKTHSRSKCQSAG
jgi:hypothetical protein